MALTVFYWPVRGRAEVVRLIAAAKGLDLQEAQVDYAAMKGDLEAYPFGQCPK